MNLPILSAEIVRRVQHSPDCALNLAEVVSNLIQAEQDRAARLEHSERLQRMRETDNRRALAESLS